MAQPHVGNETVRSPETIDPVLILLGDSSNGQIPQMTDHPVLVVDDDSEAREALSCLLELNGFTVVTAGDGDEALGQLRDGLRPCLIVLDLMMPQKDGFAFRHEQLEAPDLAAIPVAVCSAVYDVRQASGLLRADAYLTKPVDVDALLNLVIRHCERCRLTRTGSA
jgi:CheY-like chemotaxis protein